MLWTTKRVALTHVVDGTGQLGAVGVLATRLILEHLVQLDAIELTIRFLVDRADPLVTDALAHIARLPHSTV